MTDAGAPAADELAAPPPPRLAVTYQALPGQLGRRLPRRVAAAAASAGRRVSRPAWPWRCAHRPASLTRRPAGWATGRAGRRTGWPATRTRRSRPTPNSLFDLASLTKVVATLPLVLLLHQRGQWSIDDPVARMAARRAGVAGDDQRLPAAHRRAGAVPAVLPQLCERPAEIRRAVIAELADAVRRPAGELQRRGLHAARLGGRDRAPASRWPSCSAVRWQRRSA